MSMRFARSFEYVCFLGTDDLHEAAADLECKCVVKATTVEVFYKRERSPSLTLRFNPSSLLLTLYGPLSLFTNSFTSMLRVKVPHGVVVTLGNTMIPIAM